MRTKGKQRTATCNVLWKSRQNALLYTSALVCRLHSLTKRQRFRAIFRHFLSTLHNMVCRSDQGTDFAHETKGGSEALVLLLAVKAVARYATMAAGGQNCHRKRYLQRYNQ